MPLQTFRYAACGGGNTLLGLVIFFVSYHYIFTNDVVTIGFLVFKSHKAALFLSSICTFFVGFLLNKFVVFTESSMKGRIQIFRYFLSFFGNLCIAAFLQTLMVEMLRLDAYWSQILITIFIVALSYFTQKHFTFKK